MIDSVVGYIKAYRLFEPGDTLIVGVSGGVDSMVLLDLMVQLRDSWMLKLVAAHFNYRLRGVDSDRDEELVRQYCEQRGLRFECRRQDAAKVADKDGTPIQETARNLRYAWFETLRDRYRAGPVVLAHHADDNVETILYHLAKGTGIAGLRGMKPKNNRDIVRPMLALSKDRIKTYAVENRIVWREDRSNEKPDYVRNLIRLEVLPVLKRINPSLSDHFEDTHRRLLGTESLVEEKLALLRDQCLSTQNGIDRWETTWVREDDQSLMLISSLLKVYGFGYRESRDIFHAICEPHGQMFFSADYRVGVSSGFLDIERLGLTIEEGAREVGAKDRILRMSGWQYELEYRSADHLTFSADEGIAYMDADRLQYPLVVRKWEPGDRMCPLGMEGSKKISDLLIDHKISNIHKDKTHVWISGDEIVWLAGVRIGHKVRVRPQTRRVLKIRRI